MLTGLNHNHNHKNTQHKNNSLTLNFIPKEIDILNTVHWLQKDGRYFSFQSYNSAMKVKDKDNVLNLLHQCITSFTATRLNIWIINIKITPASILNWGHKVFCSIKGSLWTFRSLVALWSFFFYEYSHALKYAFSANGFTLFQWSTCGGNTPRYAEIRQQRQERRRLKAGKHECKQYRILKNGTANVLWEWKFTWHVWKA